MKSLLSEDQNDTLTALMRGIDFVFQRKGGNFDRVFIPQQAAKVIFDLRYERSRGSKIYRNISSIGSHLIE